MQLKYSWVSGHTPNTVIRRLLQVYESLFVVKMAVWKEVNEFLASTATMNFLDQANSYQNAEKTKVNKRALARNKKSLEVGADGETDTAKDQFTETYGRMTGFFLKQLSSAKLGSRQYMIREVMTTQGAAGTVVNGMLNWGARIPDFARSYPGFIFGAVGGLDGEPGIISLNRGDLETARGILVTYYQLLLARSSRG